MNKVDFIKEWALDDQKVIDLRKLCVGTEIIIEMSSGLYSVTKQQNSVHLKGAAEGFLLIPSPIKFCKGLKPNEVKRIRKHLSKSVQLEFRGSRLDQYKSSLLIGKIMHNRCMEFAFEFEDYFYSLVSDPVLSATVHGKNFKYKMDWCRGEE